MSHYHFAALLTLGLACLGNVAQAQPGSRSRGDSGGRDTRSESRDRSRSPSTRAGAEFTDRMFDRLDLDGDGRITRREYHRAMEQIRDSMRFGLARSPFEGRYFSRRSDDGPGARSSGGSRFTRDSHERRDVRDSARGGSKSARFDKRRADGTSSAARSSRDRRDAPRSEGSREDRTREDHSRAFRTPFPPPWRGRSDDRRQEDIAPTRTRNARDDRDSRGADQPSWRRNVRDARDDGPARGTESRSLVRRPPGPPWLRSDRGGSRDSGR